VQPTKQALKGKGLKVALLVGVLVAIIIIILAIAFMVKPSTPPGTTKYTPTEGEIIKVGTFGAAATVSKNGAVEKVLEAGEIKEGERGYVFCRQLNSGDKIATMGDDDKYSIDGPVWFVYVDESPDAFFEHDVKYIFIDASTGEKKVYQESWPPDVNGEDLFDAGEGCGGVQEVYVS